MIRVEFHFLVLFICSYILENVQIIRINTMLMIILFCEVRVVAGMLI